MLYGTVSLLCRNRYPRLCCRGSSLSNRYSLLVKPSASRDVRQPERGAGDRAIGAGVLYRQEPQLRKGLSLPLLIRASGNQHSIVQAAERAFRLGWGVLAVVYNTRVMRLSLSWRLDRGAALVAVAALLLGVGAFLSWSAGG